MYEYSRSGNPTREVLEQCLAALENGKHGLAFASGLGATTAVTQMLKSGDHLLAADDMYGGTNRLFSNVTKNQGIEVTFADFVHLDKLKDGLRPNTKVYTSLWYTEK